MPNYIYTEVEDPEIGRRLPALRLSAKSSGMLNLKAMPAAYANHMRLWLAPVTVKGVSVWVGQVSRDIGIKFSGRFWPPTTHLVDPDMDDARFYVLQEMVDSGSVSRLGFVKGHFTAGLSTPHQNAEDDPYFTDGLRAVFFMSEKPVSKPNIDIHPWELPSLMAPYRDRLLASPSPPSPAGTLERR